jgi:hypothetical protein
LFSYGECFTAIVPLHVVTKLNVAPHGIFWLIKARERRRKKGGEKERERRRKEKIEGGKSFEKNERNRETGKESYRGRRKEK